LSSKLSLWLDDAIFKVGSKAILIFPTSSIANVIADTSSSVESISSTVLTSIHSSDVRLSSLNCKYTFDDTFNERITSAIEGVDFDPKIKDGRTQFKTHLIHNMRGIRLNPFDSKDLGSIIYTDDPTLSSRLDQKLS